MARSFQLPHTIERMENRLNNMEKKFPKSPGTSELKPFYKVVWMYRKRERESKGCIILGSLSLNFLKGSDFVVTLRSMKSREVSR